MHNSARCLCMILYAVYHEIHVYFVWQLAVDILHLSLISQTTHRYCEPKVVFFLLLECIQNMCPIYSRSKDGHLLRALDRERMSQLYEDLKTWEGIIAQQSEEFSGDMFLAGEDSIRQIRKQVIRR